MLFLHGETGLEPINMILEIIVLPLNYSCIPSRLLVTLNNSYNVKFFLVLLEHRRLYMTSQE